MINETTTTMSNDQILFTFPKILSEIQHITTADTGGLEFVICCDKLKLFIFPLLHSGNKSLASAYQSLPISNIKSLRTIAKNFIMIETQSKYLGIFQIIKSAQKQQPSDKPGNSAQANTVKVEFSQVLKWRTFSSYFIREVMENLFQVQVFFTDLQFEIFHFTNKNKKGSMSFTISQNGRILKSTKKQLYGSKFFFNIGRKLIYWMKNFSDKQFILQEIVTQQPLGPMKLEPFGYFGVQRAQQYKILLPNLVIKDCLNPAKKHSLQIEPDSFLNELKAQISSVSLSTKKKNSKQQENPFNQLVQRDGISQLLQTYKFTIFTDLLMVENKQKKKMEIYQIRTEGSSIVAKQSSVVQTQKQDSSTTKDLSRWQWHFGNSKKLIGIDRIGFKLKYVQQMSLREKSQQIKENTQMSLIRQGKSQNQIKEEKYIQQKDNPQNKTKNISQTMEKQENNAQLSKKKFSKDQLKQQVKNSLQKQFKKEQFLPETNPKEKQQEVKHLQVQKSKSKKKNQEISKTQQKNNKSQNNEKQEEKKQDHPSKIVKEKPPMKIIQKNKVSVAKSFISQSQNQSKQNTKNNEGIQVKKQAKQTQSKQIEKQKIQQNQLQNTKIINTQKDNLSIQEKQNQKDMKNNTEQQRYSVPKSSNQQQKKQQRKIEIQKKTQTQKEDKKVKQGQKNSKPQPKQEKKKINVITRASLNKKKQTQIIKETQPERQFQNSKKEQLTLVQTQKIPSQTIDKTNTLKTKVQVLPSSQNKEKQSQKSYSQEEDKPKTRFIPSIDSKKASENQLNECQFLSEDSLSEQDEQISNEKNKPNKSLKVLEEQEIEQQIEGESGYSSGQEDMQHLIDDDIKKNQTKLPQKQQLKQISPDEEIQKFCNDLLEDNSAPSYKKSVTVTSSKQVVSKEKSQSNIVTHLKSTKQQTNEINQLNSLLFKTNIKRENIFEPQEKSEGPKKKDQTEIKKQIVTLKHQQKSEKQNNLKPFQNHQKNQNQKIDKFQTQKSQVQKKIEEKKPKVWHQLSSDSDDEMSPSENQEKTQKSKAKSQDKQQKNILDQQQKINSTLQNLQIAQSQCTKILSDIEKHKAKQIQSKILQGKSIQQTHSVPEKQIINGQILKQTQKDVIEKTKQSKPQANIFQTKTTIKENPFLKLSSNSIFPLNPTPKWLQNKPLSQHFQNTNQNPFINFKKSIQQSQSNHHNLFGLGQKGNNSNMFRNFLNQRQNKSKKLKNEERVIVQNEKQQQANIQIQQNRVNQRKQVQQKNKKQSPVQEPQFIPSTLLPKIQQLISSYEESTLKLLQKQQTTILKSLQQIPDTHNPYNKNHSLLLPEQIKEEIIKQSKNTVKKWLANKMLDKIQASFRQIMQEHKKVYQDALKYYENQAKRKITTMQLQYEQQQTILTDIQNVAANLSSALQGSVLQGQQMHTFQLKQWKNHMAEMENNFIMPLNQNLQDSKHFYQQRNKNLSNLSSQLGEIKQILKNKLKKKQQLKEKKKIKMQQKKKQEEIKKSKRSIQEPKKQKSPKLKNYLGHNMPQYYNMPQYGLYESQMYPRPNYQYY